MLRYLVLLPRIFRKVKHLHQWLLANKLSLNVGKTEYMLIGFKQRLSQITTDPQVLIGTQNINRVKCTKTIGVLVDENITWKDHIDTTCFFISNRLIKKS